MPYDEYDRYYERDDNYELGRRYECTECGSDYSYGDDAAACCEDDDGSDDDNGERDCGEQEKPLTPAQRAILPMPLLHLLRKGGRVWSAEAEVNGVSPHDAARMIGCNEEGYTTKPDHACIIAASDCTVGAEIKVSCMRDGAKAHANMARHAYETLNTSYAYAGDNCGHHVHTDATRQTDLGTDAVRHALSAALTLARVCRNALTPLAASGFHEHRGGGHAGNLTTPVENALSMRSGLHASNAHTKARYEEREQGYNGIPTWEYRYPNGTTEAIRAHAHAGIALGLQDFAERATLDRDPEARAWLRRASDRDKHAAPWTQADAAAVLAQALHLHQDTHRALSVAAESSPSADAQHRAVWRIAATL